ncbi:hypothetical protein ABIE89_000379 [Bradyrhizobium niftali]
MTIAVSSRATRRPEIDVSGMAPRHSLGDVVDHVEDAEASAISELVVDEVQRPARVGLCLDQDRDTGPHGLASPPLAEGEPFFPAKLVDPVVPRWLALPPQQDEQPAIAETPPLVGEIAHRPRRTASGGRLEQQRIIFRSAPTIEQARRSDRLMTACRCATAARFAQLLATILFDKFGMHIPLNRQSVRFKTEGIDLPLSTLADQIGHGTFAVMLLFHLIERHVDQ